MKYSTDNPLTKIKGKLVYFIGADGDYVKIGVSNNPVRRLNSLQQGNPHEIWLMAIINSPAPYASEAALHEKFADKHIRGEWYLLDRPDDYEFIRRIADLNAEDLSIILAPPEQRRELTLRRQALVG